jgi:hypothetical protein
MIVFFHANFKLDLTFLNVTFSELNQWFKSDFSTAQTIPFEITLDSELSKSSGFQAHYNAYQNQTIFYGHLEKDGEIIDAILKFLSIKGNVVSVIINLGLDDFPSFDKKLSELNLETKLVTDIIADANSVIHLSYPETNYSYPMIHTDKYDPTSTEWNGFKKIINNYAAGQFLSNSLQIDTNIDLIKNIIQPLPFLMHILKTAISDAEYTLAGDILTDYNLNNALVFRDGLYYKQATKTEFPIVAIHSEWSSLGSIDNSFQYVNFVKEIVITQKGDYTLFGTINSIVYTARKNPASTHDRYRCSGFKFSIIKIAAGVSTIISSYEEGRQDDGTSNLGIQTREDSFDKLISLNVGDVIRITKTEPRRDLIPLVTPDYSEAISLKLIPFRYKNADGSPIISVLNLTEVNLKNVVPDMTVRDLIAIIKNWFNYDFVANEKVISMNLIENNLDRSTAKKIDETEIEEPSRIFHEDRTFELSFSDGKVDAIYKYDSIFIQQSGVTVNNYTVLPTTNSIKIDALPLPVITRDGVKTAFSFQDETSKLRLVFMKPMPEGGSPVTFENKAVLMRENYESKFKKWLDFRINSIEWNWEFVISVEKFREITIQTLVYAYGNYHLLSDLEKTRLDNFYWKIAAKTESLI